MAPKKRARLSSPPDEDPPTKRTTRASKTTASSTTLSSTTPPPQPTSSSIRARPSAVHAPGAPLSVPASTSPPPQPTSSSIRARSSAVHAPAVLATFHPYHFWAANHARFPNLACVARSVLAVPASSAESERLFSAAGLIHRNSLRSSLSAQNTEMCLLIAVNEVKDRARAISAELPTPTSIPSDDPQNYEAAPPHPDDDYDSDYE